MGVNSLPKTVTRQRRACDFWTQALLRMNPAWVRFLVYNTDLVQYRWTDSGSTESARLENRKLFKILFKSCCTYVFHRCRFVLAFSVLAFSTLAYSYLRIPYLHIPSSGTFVYRTCVFNRPPHWCSPKKRGGRLKQDLDKDFLNNLGLHKRTLTRQKNCHSGWSCPVIQLLVFEWLQQIDINFAVLKLS